jgi:hypothetical protein
MSIYDLYRIHFLLHSSSHCVMSTRSSYLLHFPIFSFPRCCMCTFRRVLLSSLSSPSSGLTLCTQILLSCSILVYFSPFSNVLSVDISTSFIIPSAEYACQVQVHFTFSQHFSLIKWVNILSKQHVEEKYLLGYNAAHYNKKIVVLITTMRTSKLTYLIY